MITAIGLFVMIGSGLLTFLALHGWVRRPGVAYPRPSNGQYAALLIPIATLFAMMAAPSEGWLILLGMEALALFAWAWVVEFVNLMGLSDDAFPGRFDKLVWIALMIFLPPVGVAAFWTFRRAHWPAEKPATNAAYREVA